MSDPISRRVTIDALPYTYPKLATNSQQSCNRLATDYISRQDAIDAPEKFTKDCNPEHFVGNQKFIEFMDSDEIRSFGKWQFANGFNMGLTAAEVAIKKLPSAEPEWIPVEECLPKESGLYVVSIDTKGSAMEVGYPDGLVYASAYDAVSMCWGYANKRVTAWMPLPEPYRESE